MLHETHLSLYRGHLAVLSQSEAQLRISVGDGQRDEVGAGRPPPGGPHQQPVGRRRPQLDRHLVVLLAAATEKARR